MDEVYLLTNLYFNITLHATQYTQYSAHNALHYQDVATIFRSAPLRSNQPAYKDYFSSK